MRADLSENVKPHQISWRRSRIIEPTDVPGQIDEHLCPTTGDRPCRPRRRLPDDVAGAFRELVRHRAGDRGTRR